MKIVTARRVMHDGESRVSLRFPYENDFITIAKGLPDARWSQRMDCWHIKDSTEVISIIFKAFHGIAFVDYSNLKLKLAEKIRLKKEEELSRNKVRNRLKSDTFLSQLSKQGEADIADYRRWMQAQRFPDTTVETYTAMMIKFLRFVSPKEASACTSDDLTRIIKEYILPNGLSHSYQNQMISSVKKFYSVIYSSVIDPGKITRPRPQHRLPNVLSKGEIKKIITGSKNEKHRLMLTLIYACGLRRSELLELMPGDIEKGRQLLRIRQSKGFKDRIVPISVTLIEMIETYIGHYNPKKYLFEGQVFGKKYSASSLEKVLKVSCEKAGLSKEVTLHWLRHSYATHLLEAGTDIRYIQELLGHKSSKTTEIYTHVTTQSIQKIRSPFDDL